MERDFRGSIDLKPHPTAARIHDDDQVAVTRRSALTVFEEPSPWEDHSRQFAGSAESGHHGPKAQYLDMQNMKLH